MPDASTCPRCGGSFACGAADGRCDCFDLQLNLAQQAAMAACWPGRCLCMACLRALQAEALRACSDAK